MFARHIALKNQGTDLKTLIGTKQRTVCGKRRKMKDVMADSTQRSYCGACVRGAFEDMNERLRDTTTRLSEINVQTTLLDIANSKIIEALDRPGAATKRYDEE